VNRIPRIALFSLLVALGAAGVGRAQVPTSPSSVVPVSVPASASSTEPARPQIPLKIQVTLVRYQGEKKVSSIPFTLSVTANDGQMTVFNNGQRVPVSEGPNGPLTYQNVGTSINASAAQVEGGRFRLTLTVTDSSIATTAREPRGPAPVELVSAPTIKSLTVTNRLLLRDGQPTEFLASTDQITGEVTRIEVLLTVVK
jgi:hypothetical protein